ncbi:MAG: hypothetical protein R3D34_00545 [Nitratireductor sp.]
MRRLWVFLMGMVRDHRNIKTTRLLLSLALTLALVMTAFAHRAASLNDVSSIDLAAYVLPDGSTPSLCVGDDGSAGGKSSKHAHPCEFCRIAGSAGLAVPPDDCVPQSWEIGREPTLQHGIAGQMSALFPAAPHCGPPSLSA